MRRGVARAAPQTQHRRRPNGKLLTVRASASVLAAASMAVTHSARSGRAFSLARDPDALPLPKRRTYSTRGERARDRARASAGTGALGGRSSMFPERTSNCGIPASDCLATALASTASTSAAVLGLSACIVPGPRVSAAPASSRNIAHASRVDRRPRPAPGWSASRRGDTCPWTREGSRPTNVTSGADIGAAAGRTDGRAGHR